MDLIGDEKRIQALFCELKLEDQSRVPKFEKSCQRAAAPRIELQYTLRRSLSVIAAALLVSALCSVIFWSRNGRGPRPDGAVAGALQANPSFPIVALVNKASGANSDRRSRSKSLRRVRQVAAGRKTQIGSTDLTVQTAVAFSRWQSPTASLAEAPISSAFKSLPQLNESARELQSFLPNE